MPEFRLAALELAMKYNPHGADVDAIVDTAARFHAFLMGTNIAPQPSSAAASADQSAPAPEAQPAPTPDTIPATAGVINMPNTPADPVVVADANAVPTAAPEQPAEPQPAAQPAPQQPQS